MTDPRSTPEFINGVLTFADEGGGRWLAGITLGPLVPETGSGEPVSAEAMKDRAFTLISFKLVTPTEVQP